MLAGLLVVYALAVFRVTRLLVADKITEKVRHAVVRRTRDGSMWAYFVMCPWCVSIWVAAAVAPLAWWFGGLETPGVSAWLAVPALALAYSAVTGTLSSLVEE